MSKPYRPSLTERFHLDDPSTLRALSWSLPISLLVGFVALAAAWELGPFLAVVVGVLAFCGCFLFVGGGTVAVAHLSGTAAASFLLPSGRSTPVAEDFSQEKALVIRGQLGEAVARLQGRLRAEPADAALCLFLADLYAAEARQPERAESLFLRAKRMETISAPQDIYATNRLIDLYMGALEHPARAQAQLRHLLERHPDSQAARHAEQLLYGFPPRSIPG